MPANTRLDSLSDLSKHKANLSVKCACGRRHVLDAERFNRYAMLRVWNTQLATLGARLRCRACGRRPGRLCATPDAPTLADPFPRDEAGSKLLHHRLRD